MRVILPVVLVLAAPLWAQVGDEHERVSALAQAAGLPDPARAPFVRVLDGTGRRLGAEVWQPNEVLGVVLQDDGRTFTLLTTDGRQRVLQRTPDDAPVEHRVAVAPADLAGTADALLTQFADRPPQEWQTLQHGMLAWFCGAQGHIAQAAGLWQALQASNGDRDPVAAFAEQLGTALAWETLGAFADEQTTFASLQPVLAAWLHAFGTHPRALLLRELAADLATALAAPPVSTTDPIARAIADLTDHRGGVQVDDDLPMFMPSQSPPAARLIEIGVAAVPALLHAMADRRPTRSVWYADDGVRIVRVGAVVRQILEWIVAEHVPDDVAAARQQVERWLQDVRERGEAAVLVERVSGGFEQCERAARRLVEVAPERLLPAIQAGWSRLDADHRRAGILGELRKVTGPAVTDFLYAQLTADNLRIAVAAAELLLERERPVRVVDALVDHWRRAPAVDRWTGGRVGILLARHGNAAAIAALGERRDLLDGPILYELGAASVAEPDSPIAMARKQLLGALLDDVTTRGGIDQPRLCDHAARALHVGWPQHHDFAFDDLRPDRDRQLRLLRTSLARRADSPPPVPVLVPRPEPPPGLDELLRRWLREDGAAARARLLDGVDRLEALFAVQSLRADPQLERSPERLAELDGAITRIGAIVLHCQPAAEVARLPGSQRDAILAMVGKPLDEAALAALMRSLFTDPTTLRVFELRAQRATGDAGIAFDLAVEVAPAASMQVVRRSAYGRVGRAGLLGSTGAGRFPAYRDDDEFAAALAKAASVPGLPAIEAVLRLEFASR
ncbi:MAG: hypothetical protein IPK26_08100 [Planctomycetes bacterium]|nr:hypothetical protein [Planctomycetota bacterium]